MNQNKDIIIFFEQVIKDCRLHPSHISIYVALFQCWTISRYKNPFRIYRTEVMKLGRVKSLGTYHRCLKELHSAGFIVYFPSYDPFKGSHVEIIDFELSETFIDNEFQKQKFSLPKKNLYSVPIFLEERELITTI